MRMDASLQDRGDDALAAPLLGTDDPEQILQRRQQLLARRSLGVSTGLAQVRGGQGRVRSADLPLFRRTLFRLSYLSVVAR